MNSSWSTEGGWFSKTTFYRSDFCPVTSSAHCYRACLRLTQQNTPKPNPLHSFDPVTSVAADSCLRQTEWEHNFTNMSHSCVSQLPHLAVFGNLCGESRSPISKGGLGGPEIIWWLTAGPLLIWFVTAAHVAVWFSMSPVWKRVLVSCTEKMMYNNNHASWHALICQHEISNWLRKSGKTANIDKTQQLV